MGLCPILGQTHPKPRHYRLPGNILPIYSVSTVPFWDTITSSTSSRRYPSKSSLARVVAVSSSFNQALAQFMLYTVRRLSFRLDREIDASNNPSRGRRRRHCSVMPAAPLRRGMEGGKERPCRYYNRLYEVWLRFDPATGITTRTPIVIGMSISHRWKSRRITAPFIWLRVDFYSADSAGAAHCDAKQ